MKEPGDPERCPALFSFEGLWTFSMRRPLENDNMSLPVDARMQTEAAEERAVIEMLRAAARLFRSNVAAAPVDSPDPEYDYRNQFLSMADHAMTDVIR